MTLNNRISEFVCMADSAIQSGNMEAIDITLSMIQKETTVVSTECERLHWNIVRGNTRSERSDSNADLTTWKSYLHVLIKHSGRLQGAHMALSNKEHINAPH